MLHTLIGALVENSAALLDGIEHTHGFNGRNFKYLFGARPIPRTTSMAGKRSLSKPFMTRPIDSQRWMDVLFEAAMEKHSLAIFSPWAHQIHRSGIDMVLGGERAPIEDQSDVLCTGRGCCYISCFTTADLTIPEEGITAAEDEIHSSLDEALIEERSILLSLGKTSRSKKPIGFTLLFR